jgi:hypothetical protein
MQFFVEMLIYVGFTPSYLADMCGATHGADYLEAMWAQCPVESTLDVRLVAYQVVENLGKAMNCLKNKPWKQTHMTTDEKQFKRYLSTAWMEFITLLKVGGYSDPAGAVLLYLDKNDVNKFRIRSAY